MFIVYVLRDNLGRLYKGVTGNLVKRLKDHKAGGTQTTRKMKSFKVVYTENYDTFVEARKREVYLKSAAGRRFLKTKL